MFGPLGAVEFLEDFSHLFAVHADALILNGNAEPVRLALAEHSHLGFGRRILDRIRQKVEERIFHQLPIARQGFTRQLLHHDLDLLAIGQRAGPLDTGLEHLAQAEILVFQLHLTRRQALHVQEHFDHAAQPLRF